MCKVVYHYYSRYHSRLNFFLSRPNHMIRSDFVSHPAGNTAAGILAHSSIHVFSRCFRFWSCRWATQSFSSLHRFYIGFRTGDWLGHSFCPVLSIHHIPLDRQTSPKLFGHKQDPSPRCTIASSPTSVKTLAALQMILPSVTSYTISLKVKDPSMNMLFTSELSLQQVDGMSDHISPPILRG